MAPPKLIPGQPITFPAAEWNRHVELFTTAVNLLDKQVSENTYAFNQPFNRTLSSPRMVSAGVRLRF